ncbi:MAG: PQQ-binding-like beta-propeller repeat protein [Candidatus Eremiobacteraeota bacterium]|nr:PQQ-binding-like beta-propeller repeat protein [Candidatus Eremiobacteraeota bacterium]
MKADHISPSTARFHFEKSAARAGNENAAQPQDCFTPSGKEEAPAVDARLAAQLLMQKTRPQPDHMVWEAPLEGGMKYPPALGPDGTLYTAGGNNRLCAIDSATGKEKWHFDTGEAFESSPLPGSDGSVIFASKDGHITALDGKDGARKWEFRTGSIYESTPVLSADGTLYVKGQNNLFALDSTTGEKKWEFRKDDVQQLTEPAVGADGKVYVACERGRVFSLNAASGKKLKTFRKGAENRLFPPVTSPGGSLYIGGPGTLYSLDRETGKIFWKYTSYSNNPLHPLVGPDGRVIIESLNRIMGIERYTGRAEAGPKWSFEVGDHNYFSSSFGPGGDIYTACGNGNIYVLDYETGRQKHVLKTGDDNFLTIRPLVAKDGTIFIGTQDKLYALNPEKKTSAKEKLEKKVQEQQNAAGQEEATRIVVDEQKVSIGGISLNIRKEVP